MAESKSADSPCPINEYSELSRSVLTGPYKPKDDVGPERQLARGKIDVELFGAKLRGGFTLVRTGKPGSGGKEQWLLIKQRDAYADPSWNIESPRLDRSVLTGRSLKEIKEDRKNSLSHTFHVFEERAVIELFHSVRLDRWWNQRARKAPPYERDNRRTVIVSPTSKHIRSSPISRGPP